MKLTLAEALATVLNIKRVPSVIEGGDASYVRVLPDGELNLGYESEMTLIMAVKKAVSFDNLTDLSIECHYAIFPIDSDRGKYYMEIEKASLQEEATLKTPHAGKKLWELFLSKDDPRENVTAIMTTLRNCAGSLFNPTIYRVNMIRVAALAVATLQWVDHKISNAKAKLIQPVIGAEKLDQRDLE